MLRRLLPALIPSWRFFDRIAPSPRLEYTLLPCETDSPRDWVRFRSTPAVVAPHAMLARLFWNPRGNEMLYLMECCERLLAERSAHAQQELRASLERELSGGAPPGAFLVFRILLCERQGASAVERVAFVSAPSALAARA